MLDETHQPNKALLWFNLKWGWVGGGEFRGWQHASFLTGIELTQMSSAYQICLVFIGVLSVKVSQ